MSLFVDICNGIFQSTLSVRRATDAVRHVRFIDIISIHALRKESDVARTIRLLSMMISIHALRKESDRHFDSANS